MVAFYRAVLAAGDQDNGLAANRGNGVQVSVRLA